MGINKVCGATSKIADPEGSQPEQENKGNTTTKVTREAEPEEEVTSPGDTTVSTAGGNFQYYKYVHFDLIKI